MFDGIDAGSWGEIIVGVVAIIVGVYVVVRWQVDKRKLGYQIRTNSIIRVDGVHSDEIEIKFKGTEVKTLTLFSIAFKNLGNRPILKADWEKPIEIVFDSKETKILDIKIASSYPSDLEVATITHQSDDGVTVVVNPLLLNAKEGFKLQLIISELVDAKIKTRVVGISNLIQFDEDYKAVKKFHNFKASHAQQNLFIFFMVCIIFGLASDHAILSALKKEQIVQYEPILNFFTSLFLLALFVALRIFIKVRNIGQNIDENFLEK